MPPKPKFTKEEIVATALTLVSQKGIDALTARELGECLGSSARPIFTVFKNMEELQGEVRAAAMKRFEGYAEKAMHYTPIFKQIGMQMVLFASEEPKLYQLLFMKENGETKNFKELFSKLGNVAETCVQVIRKDYDTTEQEAYALFENVWVYTYGIGALCATKMCQFSEADLMRMLGTDFMAMMMLIKSGKLNEPTPYPVQQEEQGENH
jgi:AcrR family transcriptional regulator